MVNNKYYKLMTPHLEYPSFRLKENENLYNLICYVEPKST